MMNDNAQFKCGFITLIGRPNVGKSTLMNQLIGQKIAITSAKPQTTRKRILTVYTDERCQMIFLDTPGMNAAKNRLGDYMLRAARGTLSEVDVILFLVEPDTYIGANEREIIRLLHGSRQPLILVVNKIDTVPEARLERVIEAYRRELDFVQAVGVSALKRERLTELTDTVVACLPYGPPLYDEDMLTDEPERDIVAEIIREKALRLLKEEVPHGIAVTVERMRERKAPRKRQDAGTNGKDGGRKTPVSADRDEPLIDIEATIICEKDSHKGIVIGKGGAMLKRIGSAARADIERLLDSHVNLRLFVKVRKDWRDDPTQLRGLGYRA